MKLIQVDFCLDWPGSIKVTNLRRYVISLMIKREGFSMGYCGYKNFKRFFYKK